MLRLLLACLFLLTTSAQAAISASSSPTSDDIFADLSQCDNKFFTTLGARADELSTNSYFRSIGPIGYFQVSDRGNQKLSVSRFSPSQKLGSFEVVGYFDEIFSIGNQGQMISWGFLLRAPIEQVVTVTKSLIWESERLKRDGQVYVRSELWAHKKSESGWQKITTVGGQAPQAGTVERVLLIEPFEDDPGLIRFGCSLQGSVTREMLRRLRPDLSF